jgi:hypothetical protein
MKRIGFCVLLATAIVACAAPPSLKLPDRVNGDPGDFIMVTADTTGKNVQWFSCDSNLKIFPASLLKETKTAVVTCRVPGSYKLMAITCAGDELSPVATTVVVVGKPPPTPTPTPTPDPSPDVNPGPAPIQLDGFRVLVVYESEDVAKMPVTQSAVLFSKDVRGYLNSKCVIGADGVTREWRIWDKDTNVAAESKHWQDAMTREKKSIPWILISDGKKGYEGPLPATVADTMKLLKQYGGE